ncbi:MAG: IS3 family transposase [Candidatus Andersenbacteria bacterium]|nr:IS3 family transposase [Candidatus Andersenbacteria bacterium]
MSHKERASCIERDHPTLSVATQSNLLDISRASVYYEPIVNEEDIRIMHAIDRIFTKRPFYGSRRIRQDLKDEKICICREHVQRLMRLMGLEAIYPKKRTTTPHPEHKKYPYLLRGIPIIRPNQVYGTDITYVKLECGFCYLVAHLDWFSRYVVAWELSASLDSSFCIDSLTRAIAVAIPELQNSDQGVQFTSKDYTDILLANNIQISMDGRGRCMDNIFTERLWRTVKYEDIFLRSYRTIDEARKGLTEYFHFYNTERKHQSLDYRTPAEVYFGTQE